MDKITKMAYFIQDTVKTDDDKFIVCIVKEGESGFYKLDYDWGKDKDVAQELCDEVHGKLGISPKEACWMVIRSMANGAKLEEIDKLKIRIIELEENSKNSITKDELMEAWTDIDEVRYDLEHYPEGGRTHTPEEILGRLNLAMNKLHEYFTENERSEWREK